MVVFVITLLKLYYVANIFFFMTSGFQVLI